MTVQYIVNYYNTHNKQKFKQLKEGASYTMLFRQNHLSNNRKSSFMLQFDQAY